MALKDISKIDKKLTKIYEDQVTTNKVEKFIDRSDVLIAQMNFIALSNKSLLNLK